MYNSCIVGIDIGGTNFRIGAVDYENGVTNFRKIKTASVFHSERPLADLTLYLKGYFKDLADDDKRPEAIAIGFPAAINKERTVVLQAPNVAFMEKLPVVEVLSKELNIPVFIERDVTMTLLYDQMKLGLENCEILIGCYFGTDLGNALLIQGKMVAGRNGTAGELGHIPVAGNMMKCGCGNEGCMETVGAGRYLTYLCNEVYKDTKIEDLFTKHGEEPLLREFVDRMAIAVTTELNILEPRLHADWRRSTRNERFSKRLFYGKNSF